ncbi:MAG: hypothetical protein KF691_01530 [Phycisphaeraceae bacterium]|nr:hypothetical protein [Phycisphaeraceae bacterium]
MPAWPKLKLPLLADLAEQLRFAPKGAVVNDIKRTIETIQLLEPDNEYPTDWIAFRITGYRREAAEIDSLPGSRLRPELARLVEFLSAQSRLTSEDLKPLGPGFDQPELLKRWNISRKSLERYRSRGLVAVRMLSSQGRSSLFFPRSTTDSFEAANARMLERASAFSRLDGQSRESIRRRAERLKRKAPVSRARLSGHLAKRSGRSRAAIERALPARKRSERRPRQSNKARKALLDKWESGTGAGALAKQARKTRPAIVRALGIARRDRIERWDPSTRLPHGFRSLSPDSLGELAKRHPDSAAVVHPPAETELESLLESMRLPETPERHSERDFVIAHHSLMQIAGSQETLSADGLDLAETALRWAAKLRAALIRPHRRVMIESIDSLVGVALLRSDPFLLTSAIVHAVRGASLAIEMFMPEIATRREIGGNLAGPISLAVSRALAEWARSSEKELRSLRIRHPTHATRAARALGAIPDWTEHASPWQEALSPVRLRSQRDDLPAQDARVLRLRFGWQSTRPHTSAEIAQELGLTRIRAGATIQRAVRTALA